MSNKKCTAAGLEPATSRAGHPYYNHYATNPESRNPHAINYMIASVFASNLVNLISNPAGFGQTLIKALVKLFATLIKLCMLLVKPGQMPCRQTRPKTSFCHFSTALITSSVEKFDGPPKGGVHHCWAALTYCPTGYLCVPHPMVPYCLLC